jgi:hypothetical protein
MWSKRCPCFTVENSKSPPLPPPFRPSPHCSHLFSFISVVAPPPWPRPPLSPETADDVEKDLGPLLPFPRWLAARLRTRRPTLLLDLCGHPRGQSSLSRGGRVCGRRRIGRTGVGQRSSLLTCSAAPLPGCRGIPCRSSSLSAQDRKREGGRCWCGNFLTIRCSDLSFRCLQELNPWYFQISHLVIWSLCDRTIYSTDNLYALHAVHLEFLLASLDILWMLGVVWWSDFFRCEILQLDIAAHYIVEHGHNWMITIILNYDFSWW